MQLRHTYDFGTQDKATLETIFTGYANRQFQLSAANVSLLDLTIGPRFQVFAPHLRGHHREAAFAGGAIWVNDTPYYGELGRRRRESTRCWRTGLRSITTAVWRRHEQPGHELPADQQPVPRHRILGHHGLSVRAHPGRLAVRQRQRPALPVRPGAVAELPALGRRRRHELPLRRPGAQTGLPWTVSLTASNQWWHYDAPDPTIDPNIYRDQSDFILNLTLAIPFDERTTFSVSGGRFVRSATLPNYAFEQQ